MYLFNYLLVAVLIGFITYFATLGVVVFKELRREIGESSLIAATVVSFLLPLLVITIHLILR